MTSSLNLNTLFGEIQCTLEKNINMMLNEERLKHSEYKELHNHIMSLPVVAKLVAENKTLREKLAEYEDKKICLEVVEKELPINTKKIIYTNSGESMMTDDLCNCDLCSNIVNCLKQNIYILTRGDEEMVLCVDCFEEQKIRLKTDHWKSDDFSEAETSDVESDSDSSEEEEDEEKEEEEQQPRKWGQYLGDGSSITKDVEKEEEEETVKLCKNQDCSRYPPDWDFEEDTEDTYNVGQWQKCNICDGYFNDDGCEDILYIEEEPNNQEAGCNLCGKVKNIVQMKGTGQYICGNACDEEEEEDEEEDEGDGARFGDIINNEEEEADEEEPSGDEKEEVENVEEPSGEEDKVICELCNIKLTMDDIIELDRETEQSKETFCLCENCLQDKADHLRGEGWNVDEFFEEEEEEDDDKRFWTDIEKEEPSGEEASEAEEEEEEPSGEEASEAEEEEPSCNEEEEEPSCNEEEEEPSCNEEEEEPSGEEEEEEPSGEEEEEEPSGEEASEAEEEEPSGEEEEEEEEPSGEEEEEDDEEVEEIMIKQKMYYTNDVDHGSIYEDDDGEVGKKVGIFNNGNAIFN